MSEGPPSSAQELLERYDAGEREFKYADLRNAILRSTDLSGANLHGVVLSDADLTGTFLSGANLSSANLSGANLDNAKLSCRRALRTPRRLHPARRSPQ